jgi:hypothetical protein
MKDIEEFLSLDEKSSADFILSLRKRWADTVYPAFITEVQDSEVKFLLHKKERYNLRRWRCIPGLVT